MSLDAGGHLTHGFRPNISGKMFHQASYGTDPATGLLDYDQVRAKAREFRPLILIAATPPTPGRSTSGIMREIADEVGAPSWWTWPTSPASSPEGLHRRLRPDPRPHIVTTTTHKPCAAPRRHGCCARASWPSRWIAAAPWCSAGRSPTSWPPRPSLWPKPARPTSPATPKPSSPTPRRSPRACGDGM
ncbi:Serine hydroxymethyltransferase [[Actinomadura] parvosata subsp. kistnae]|nr:Serine hydroxymethyltransferase [Actinomadura parvosata subsp. kistnae]